MSRKLSIVRRTSWALLVLAIPLALSIATAAGSTAAGRAKKSVLPRKTIGILNIAAADPAAIDCQRAITDPAKHLGWSTKVIDAHGNPIKMASGMKQLVLEKVDAIDVLAIDPTAIAEGLRQAAANHIPVVLSCGAGSPSPLLTQIVPSDAVLAAILGDYVINRLNGQGNVAILTTDALPWALARTNILKTMFSAYPGIKTVSVHQVDFANFVTDVQTAVAGILKTTPKLNAIITIVSPYATPATTALRQANAQKRVFVASFYGTTPNLAYIQKGDIAALATVSLLHNGYQAVDALVQWFGKKTPISPASQYRLPLQYQLINKSNLPANGRDPDTSGYKSYYYRLWASEFSNVK